MITKRKLISLFFVIAMVAGFMPLSFEKKEVKAAETWRSALYPENWTPGYSINNGTQYLHDFSYAGYEMGEKDLPTTMSGMYVDVTTAPYNADNTGTNDATTAIQNAINAVQNAGGGTVYLPAGTYKVKPATANSAALKITGSNVLFKGAGIGKTFIRCFAESMRFSQVITVTSSSGGWNTATGTNVKLSKDITTPTTTIPVSSASGFKTGDWVVVRSDRTQGFIDEHQMNGFWSATLNPTTMGPTFYRQVKSVNTSNNTVEIDIPTRYALKTRDNARIYKVNAPNQRNTGLMDFSIGNKMSPKTTGWGEEDYKTSGNGAYDADNAFLIKFSNNINCFAKNIATYQAGNSSQYHMLSNGLDISSTRNLTVENCDFSYPQYEGGNGNGYGINICGQETLIKNCSSTSARHSFAFKYSYANGNVIYHYTSTDPKYGSDFHMYLSMSNLIDNEELNGDFVESNVRPYGGTAGNRHGVTSSQTVFWNTKGNRYKSGTNYIIDSRQHGYGYIIGTQGAATNVKTTPTKMSSTYGSPDTAPEDYKEGIGTGQTLSPQSLYYDQLEKRLGKSVTEPEVKVHTIPGTMNSTEYSTASNGITKNTTASGIQYIGNLIAQSSIEYKTNIERTGKYRLDVSAVSGNNNSTRMLSFYLDDKPLSTLTVINKTDWEDFQNISSEIEIPSLGEHTLKIVSSGSANISDIKFTKIAEIIPGKVSVGAYSAKSDEIKLSTNEDVLLAGNLIDGSYLEYSVNVQKAGKYNMLLDLATINAGRILTISVDGVSVGTVSPAAAATWFTFETYKTEVSFATTGEHKVKISTTGSCNISNLVFEENTSVNIPTTPSNTKFGNNYKVIAYYPNWAGNITGKVQWDKLTHVYYAFGLPNENGYMESIDGQANNINAMVTAAHNNNVKAILSVGGWSYSDGRRCSTVFEKATNTDEKCKSLADSIVAATVKYKFDGVDIDWEYPTTSSSAQFAAFIKYLRQGCNQNGLELTAAVAATSGTGYSSEVIELFDFLNIMAYDGNEGAGHSPYSMVENCYNYWHNTKGVPSNKIVMGVPFYERPNWASYADIVKADVANAQKDSTVINGTIVYYNGIPTMKKKAEYAAKNCGGIMIWEISQDSTDESLSLLSAIYDVTLPIVGKGENVQEVETTPKPAETTPKPAETTPKPVETTPKPAETTPKPAETTPKPVETTPKPAETTPKLAETTSKKVIKTTVEKRNAKEMEKEILNLKNDKDPSYSTFGKLQAKVIKSTKKSNKVTWKKISGATKYVIYGAKCGTSYKRISSVKKNSFVHKKLKKGTYYKYMVVAQNKKGEVLAVSRLIHAATKGGKVGNCKKVKLNKVRLQLKKGKKFKIKANQVVNSKKLKVRNHRKIAFESSNPDVAWVSKKGVMKARKKGKCIIYVYAQNGIYTKLKVIIK